MSAETICSKHSSFDLVLKRVFPFTFPASLFGQNCYNQTNWKNVFSKSSKLKKKSHEQPMGYKRALQRVLAYRLPRLVSILS